MLEIINWSGGFVIGFLIGALGMYLVILIHMTNENDRE